MRARGSCETGGGRVNATSPQAQLTPSASEDRDHIQGPTDAPLTLLVLDLRVPERGPDLGAALLAQWPSYAAYLVSFATIGIIWVNHHSLFAHVRRVDRTLLFLNLLLLMVVSVIPFPTALLGRFVIDERDSHLAAAAYA